MRGVLVVLLVLLGITATVLLIPTRLGGESSSTTAKAVDPDRDSDGDGIPDAVETNGWVTSEGLTVTADPSDADTDDDGLNDALEAGPLVSSSPVATYAGMADPRRSDTDSDGVRDADEFFLDMDPARRDTDADGLADGDELGFGSDPTRANGDGDHYSDLEEFARGSDPLGYDLTTVQRAAAAEAGAKYGDCHDCALGNGLREEQLESIYYLAGQAGSGIAVYGDVRDLAYNVWKQRYPAAAGAALGLIPAFGDAAKITATVSTFAARSERAAGVAHDFVQRLPDDVRGRLPANLLRRGVILPEQLAAGPKDNVVYRWEGTVDCPTYVGITNNFALRQGQHARAGRCFVPEMIAEGLTRGQAHAIEEACLVGGGLGSATSTVQNVRHSISPSKPYYADAVAWGSAFLVKAEKACA